MKCLKKIAIFSLVFFVSLFFIMPVQAKSTQTYSIIYDLQDANGNKIAQVKYKNKDFTSEIGREIKVRTTYFDKKYGDFDLVSEQSQKVESGKDQYIFVYRTYQPITIKGKVQFTTKEGTILLQDTFDIDSSATVENPQVYAVPDSYTIGDVTYLKMPGQVSEIKSVYYNDPSDNTYSITYYNPNNTTDYDVALKYVEEGTNDLLMQKSFHVNDQDYTYMLPKTMKINDIYYGLAENQENIIHHAVSSDVREYTVYYKKMDENTSYKWSIYKVDASTNKILGEVVQLEVRPGQSVEYQVEKEYKLGSFFLHQACERYYKTYMLVHSGTRPKSHKLEVLGPMAKSRSRGFANVFPVNTPEDREAFDKLCRAYIEARYNRLFTVSEEQYEYMLARTEALREVTIRECAARIAYYDKMIEQEENSLI